MNAPTKANELLKNRSTDDLIVDFETTNDQTMTVELGMVRGWIMDELETRDPAAFDKWIDEGSDSPRPFYS
jgi:hypothetical protein